MSRKIGIIIIALIAIVVINSLNIFGQSSFGAFMDILCTLLVGYKAYILYKKPEKSAPSFDRKPVLRIRPTTPIKKIGNTADSISTINQAKIIALIVVAVFILFAYQIVGAGAFNFFVWGDHLSGNSKYPILMWMLGGLFIGAAAGSLIVWRKYHIQFWWCTVLIIPLLSLLIFLQTISDPLGAIVPRPVVIATDSLPAMITDTVPVVHKRTKREHKIVKAINTTRRADTSSAECTHNLTEITIHTRGDSVNVYYRISEAVTSPWSVWKLKFIPQQGQFSLSDDGPVHANRLQYYYEVRSVLTRSARNPYTRSLCQGPLVIDTY